MVKPGSVVKCAYRGERIGVVLELDDPRAWKDTIAFSHRDATADAVREHVAMHRMSLERYEHRPVLWDFGKVYWDTKLIPAE